MPRRKLSTLTEQMYYVLLILKEEMCGSEITDAVMKLTHNRISLGPGTLYTILSQFLEEGVIEETKTEGRKRSYQITKEGERLLRSEYERLQLMIMDMKKHLSK